VEQDAGADQPAWIAAQYSTSPLPREVNLGDGSYLGNGKYYNRPLMKHHLYRMFVRSYVSDNVSYLSVLYCGVIFVGNALKVKVKVCGFI